MLALMLSTNSGILQFYLIFFGIKLMLPPGNGRREKTRKFLSEQTTSIKGTAPGVLMSSPPKKTL